MGPLSAGNIIRTAGRAVSRAGVASAGVANRPSSPKSSSRATHRHGGSANFHGLSLSSSLSHSPLSAGWHFCNPYCDEFEWISEDGIETENIARVSEEDANGWSVPSLDEVQGAVSAINQYEFQFFFLTLLRLFDRILIAGAVNFSSLGFLAKRRMNWVGSGCIRVW